MALLLISHDLGVVAQNVSRMLVMYGGSVVESGPTHQVFTHMAHPYTRGLMAARPQLLIDPQGSPPAGVADHPVRRLTTIPGNVPELAELPVGCPFAARCTLALSRCGAEPPPVIELGGDHQARCILLQAPTPRDAPK
jgi:oligopeptide/dipeptide ABC transporter ATP-binding protein